MAVTSLSDLYGQANDPTSAIGKAYTSANAPDAGGFANGQYGPAAAAAYAKASAAYTKKNNSTGNISSFADPYGAQEAGTQAAVAAMTPAQQSTYAYNQAEEAKGGGFFDNVTKFGPAVVMGVATGGLGAGAATAIGGLGGAVAGGAGAGALGTAASDFDNDQAVTLGSVGKGAAVGAVGGALGYAAKPAAASLSSSTGLSSNASNQVVKGGVSTATGALGGAVSGAGAGAGAEHGALSSATGTVEGSVLGGLGSVFGNNSTVTPASPSEATPLAPGNNMSDDFPPGGSELDPIDPTGQYATDNGDGTVSGGGSGQTLNAGNPLDGQTNPGNGSLNIQGPASSSGNGSILSALVSALGGSGGGASGPNASLITQLLGLAANTGAGVLNSAAAKSAAGTYANEAKYNPSSVSTADGSTTFGPNGAATATLSPAQQVTQQQLQNLGSRSTAALDAGPGAATTANFNALQSGDLQAQQRLLGNTQNAEFGNGLLGSTVGGYQTEGALQNIGQQTGANYAQASGLANTQQQTQLANLTASLNGNNQINQNQLQQIQTGITGGADASKANSLAYAPSLAANSNSNFGNILSGLASSTTGPQFVNQGG